MVIVTTYDGTDFDAPDLNPHGGKHRFCPNYPLVSTFVTCSTLRAKFITLLAFTKTSETSVKFQNLDEDKFKSL